MLSFNSEIHAKEQKNKKNKTRKDRNKYFHGNQQYQNNIWQIQAGRNANLATETFKYKQYHGLAFIPDTQES